MVYFIIFASLNTFYFAKMWLHHCFSLKGANRLKKRIILKNETALELQFGKVLHRQRMHCYIKLIEVYKHTCCVLDVMPLMPVFCLSC